MTRDLLLGLYVATHAAGVAAGSKLTSFLGLTASATVFGYAISFLITDIVAELYGEKEARRFVYAGFFGMVIAVVYYTVAIHIPNRSGVAAQACFAQVFGLSPRILLGGLTAYLVSQTLDVKLFGRLRRLTGGKHLWLRNNGSTLVSQFVDTIIFVSIAFSGTVPDIWSVVVGQYVIKLVIAVLDTPIFYLAVHLLKPTAIPGKQ